VMSVHCGQSIHVMSDVHVDIKENFEYFKQLDYSTLGPSDVLIIAGDVATKLSVISQFLELMKKYFCYVFYVPGNHDLWCPSTDGIASSLDKFNQLLRVCDELGVLYKPTLLEESKTLVFPLFSWYDCDFDEDPTSEEDFKLLADKWSDFKQCKWPSHMNSSHHYKGGISSISSTLIGKTSTRILRLPTPNPS